jgi:hypothetical protein
LMKQLVSMTEELKEKISLVKTLNICWNKMKTSNQCRQLISDSKKSSNLQWITINFNQIHSQEMLVQDSVILEELLELVLIIAMLSHLAKIIQGRICLVIPRIKGFLEGITYDE